MLLGVTAAVVGRVVVFLCICAYFIADLHILERGALENSLVRHDHIIAEALWLVGWHDLDIKGNPRVHPLQLRSSLHL